MPAPAFGAGDVGTAVTLRVRTPAGPTDVVGTVLAASAETLTVRRRDGRVEEIPSAAIVTGRRVPPSPAQRIPVRDLQLVVASGWRALEQDSLGEWMLRASGGFTRRANSALALGDPGTSVAAAVGEVGRWYDERALPPTVHTPTGAARELVELLDAEGWHRSGDAVVMTAELGHVVRSQLAGADIDVQLDDEPDDDWLAVYRSDRGPLPDVARAILTNHPAAVFASVRAAGRCVAIARATVDERWAGLFAVEVASAYRRRGLGRAVSVAALRWAGRHGARHVHLQAAVGNTAAVTLYSSLGFSVHHEYVFRVGNVER